MGGQPSLPRKASRVKPMVQQVEGCERPLDLAATAAAIVGIQSGLQGMYAGTGENVDDAFSSLALELAVSEQG